ncbi:MAG: hypothetical protein C0599_18590 [Salinivirgaceae bacterium]|nr:MAG: hypothetical protein C0599_18590 [Salinivirgaceae bacterium]
MRTKHLLLFFAVLVTGGFTALNTVTSDGDHEFASSKIAADKSMSVIPQKTAKGFEFDPLQLTDIRNELVNAVDPLEGQLNWLQQGPINVGGRTRALIIDRENPHILYAGSVAGGIYKSETNGQYWVPVETNYHASVLSVTSLAQSEDGTVYYATGDVFDSLLITKQGVSTFAGAGLFKMDENGVFQQVDATKPTDNEAFFGVTEIAIASNSQMYLSTWKGLYYTSDAGGSFSLVTSVPEEYITDVQVNSNGDVVTATQGKVYKGTVGGTFTRVSGSQEGQIEGGGRRYEFSYAPSNPDYVYAIAAAGRDTVINGNDTAVYRAGKLMGVYKSTDAGSTWTKIAIGGSDEFSVLSRELPDPDALSKIWDEPQKGIGSMMIQVDDEDADYVYVAGVDLWAGYKPAGVEQFQWVRKTYNNYSKISPLYLTANIHVMAQHPENDKAFIGCDGGIYRFEEGYGTVAMNNYYSTGLFYDLSYGPSGEYLAGAQDNGMFYNDYSGPGSQSLFAREVKKEEDFGIEENGMGSVISQLSPRIIFYNHGKSELRRSLDIGESIKEFWSPTLIKQVGGWDQIWNNGFDFYETNDYTYSYDINYQKFYDTVPADTTIIIQSQNIFGAPIEYYVENTIMPDSIMPFHDPYKSFFAVSLEGAVWLTAHSSNDILDSLDWVPPFIATRYYDTIDDPKSVQVTNVELADDGGHMFFTLVSFLENDQIKTEIFRMDSLQVLIKPELYSIIGGRVYPTPDMWDNLQKLGEVGNIEVTSLVLDPNNNANLFVTLADYSYTDKVYYCANANTTVNDDFATNFSSIQGDLPRVPVFDGIVNASPSSNTPDNQLILGTEVGVWITDDFTVGSPTWRYDSKAGVGNLGPVPIMTIKQQVNDPADFPLVENQGVLYVATWGKGIFVDSTYFVENKNDIATDDNKAYSSNGGVSINVYPNHVHDNFNVRFNLAQDGNATLRMYDLSGRVLIQEELGSFTAGSHIYEVNSSELEFGVYFVEVMSGDKKDATRVIKR